SGAALRAAVRHSPPPRPLLPRRVPRRGVAEGDGSGGPRGGGATGVGGEGECHGDRGDGPGGEPRRARPPQPARRREGGVYSAPCASIIAPSLIRVPSSSAPATAPATLPAPA